MKFYKLIGLIIVISLSVISCEKDPLIAFPGEWKSDTNGTVIFNNDGTGLSINQTFHFDGCQTILNGESDSTVFTWVATQDGSSKKGSIELSFNGSFCQTIATYPYNIVSNSKLKVGLDVFPSDATTLNRVD